MIEDYFKKIFAGAIFVVLLVLSFFVLKPILMAILFGIILAFIFIPVHKFLLKYIKYKDISVVLVCIFLALLLILPLWFLTPIIIDQIFKFYLLIQNFDFVTPLRSLMPSLFASETFSNEVGNILTSFFTKSTNSLLNSFTNIILKFPTLALQFVVVLFTFYFVLRDSDFLLKYIQDLLPFNKSTKEKLLDSTKGITMSVLYGQVIVGIIQGLIVGVGLLIFGVPGALLLTFFAMLAGVFPIVGPFIVWVPVMIYLFVSGNHTAGVGILVFGTISSTIDNFLRPFIVAKRTKMHTGIIIIGMIGGLFLFGILGLILGPLILAYLLIFLEIYRNQKIPSLLMEEDSR